MKIINRIFPIILFVFLSWPASAATFTVKNVLDDLNPGSLRWAITQVNSSPGIDTIEFHIPEGTPPIIQLTQDLPSVLSTVIIDGWTQPGKDKVGVEIRGAPSFFSTALKLEGPGSVVRGLAINSAYKCIFLRHHSHKIYGNYIGLALDGETQRSCTGEGIYGGDYTSIDTDHIEIGGDGNKRNVIVGLTGILINGENLSIKNNIIGMTATGQLTDQMPGHAMGINLSVYHAEVDSNVIGNNYLYGSGSGNTCWEGGICIKGQSKDVKITNNLIGVGPDGTSARPNKHGITVYTEAEDVVIRNNVISGNQDNGIILRHGSGNPTGAASNVQVSDNIIGLSSQGDWVIDQNGVVAQSIGIRVEGSDGLTIGSGNVISGNVTGVLVSSSAEVKIQDNTIGLGLDKTTPYPNQSYGIYISEAHSSKVQNNIIAHNGTSGVGVAAFSKSIFILNNSIFDNTSLGIDLIPNGGVTLNDEGDGDTGSNDLLNYPVLNEATYYAHTNTLVIDMSLDTPGSALVQVFANAVPDATGYGEGKTFLGQANVSPGLQTVTIQLPFSPAPGLMQNLSATSTIGGTSEFGKVLKKVKVISRENSDGEATKLKKWLP